MTECSTATDTRAAGAQDDSHSALTAGPNTTHKHIIRTETAVCTHERGSGTRQHDSRHAMLAARTVGAAPNTIRPSTQPFTTLWVYCQSIHLPYEVGPTLPHSTLVHVQVTECSTATDTHAAGAQDGSQSALTAGPNPTHKHVHVIRTETAMCAHERGSGTRQHDRRHVTLAGRTEGAPPNTIHPSTQPFTIDPLPRPNASTTRSPPPSPQRPSLTRWSRVEL